MGNVLVKVRVTFLLDCPLILSLFKHRGVEALKKEEEDLKQEKPLK